MSKPLKVLPPLFGPYGRKWINISRLRARYKIAQGPEYHKEPERPKEPARVHPSGTSGDINTPKPRRYTHEEMQEANPPPKPTKTKISNEDQEKLNSLEGIARDLYEQRQQEPKTDDFKVDIPEPDKSDMMELDPEWDIENEELSDENTAWGSPSEEELKEDRRAEELSNFIESNLETLFPDLNEYETRQEFITEAIQKFVPLWKKRGLKGSQIRDMQALVEFEAIFYWRHWHKRHKE